MCEGCVKEEYPDRGNMCLEEGSYILNYAGCKHCNKRGEINIVNRVCEEENGDEIVTYQHLCKFCDHVVADHEYAFKVDREYQVYEMSCLLCGTGEDERSIMPFDSSKQSHELIR